MKEGENKRVVKKVINNDTMNIKVSTRDKDVLLKDNEINLNIDPTNKPKRKATKLNSKKNGIMQDADINTRIAKLVEENENLQSQLNELQSNMAIITDKEVEEIISLNKELSKKENEQIKLNKKNMNLLSNLQNMEKEVSNRFASKWNASKVIAKHKKNIYKKDLNIEIKSKEGQQENIQKIINYNQKEIKKLNKLLEEANEEKLTNELKEINDKIDEIQNEIKRLNKIKFEHKLCKKNINMLKCSLNVANNELEFEFKKSNMMTLPKKEPTKISNPSISLAYGEKIRNKSLQNTKVKFSSKMKILKYKNFNFLKNEYIDNVIMPHKSLIKNKLKTTENLDSSNILKILKNDINCKIDTSTPKPYLFSESEKKVIQKLLPNEFFNHINEKYNQAENNLIKIEEKFKGNNKLKSEINLENIKNDELDYQLKKNKIVRNDLNLDISKNNRKILEIRNKIKEINDNIKRQELNLYKKSLINEKIKEQINELKHIKREPSKVDAMN
jgi:chromosome segregation ATPase